jgi:hypothetical protein
MRNITVPTHPAAVVTEHDSAANAGNATPSKNIMAVRAKVFVKSKNNSFTKKCSTGTATERF